MPRGATVTKLTIFEGMSHAHIDPKIHRREIGWNKGSEGRSKGRSSLDQIQASMKRSGGLDVHTAQEAKKEFERRKKVAGRLEEKRVDALNEVARLAKEAKESEANKAIALASQVMLEREKAKENMKEAARARAKAIEDRNEAEKRKIRADLDRNLEEELAERFRRYPLPESAMPVESLPLALGPNGLLAGQEIEIRATWKTGPGFSFVVENSRGESLLEFKVSLKAKMVTVNSSVTEKGQIKWEEPKKVAGNGVVQCEFPFQHGVPFDLGLKVQEDSFEIVLDKGDDLVALYPHRGAAALRDARTFCCVVGKADYLDGPHVR